jgi:hypothetical protein
MVVTDLRGLASDKLKDDGGEYVPTSAAAQ